MAEKPDPKKIEAERKKKIERYTTTVLDMSTYYTFLYFMAGLILMVGIFIFFIEGLKQFWTLLTLLVLSFMFAGGGFIWAFYDKEKKKKLLEKE